MSDTPNGQPIHTPPEFNLEAMLEQNIGALHYPPTPDVAAAVNQRLHGNRQPWQWSLRSGLGWIVVTLIVLLGLLAVPPVRAAILDFLQIGSVRIWLLDPTPTPLPLSTGTPAPTVTPKQALLPLAGETTLEKARKRVPWPIKLPTWPTDLGQPDAVFVQNFDGDIVVLVWMDWGDPSKVRMSLHMLTSQMIVWKKMSPEVVEETTVNGLAAYWTTGPYLLVTKQQGPDDLRLIDGHVLIWTEGDVTYRLETDASMAHAVRMAESLQ